MPDRTEYFIMTSYQDGESDYEHVSGYKDKASGKVTYTTTTGKEVIHIRGKTYEVVLTGRQYTRTEDLPC
jgi:hypothetical protein